MRKLTLAFFAITISIGLLAQKTPTTYPPTPRPKIVIGLVIDQMRWDYLYRYENKYGTDGFRRLVREGYNCQNTHINYSPSYTAPGHACIYTGSTPALHGITGNNWFDYKADSIVYCTDDASVTSVGSNTKAGKMSPNKMLTTTIGDELRLATNFHSKVIGLAIKDRSSILPAGHSANAAYWYDGTANNWISSTYYMDSLPTWVQQFNQRQLAKKYLAANWEALLPLDKYTESHEDNVPFESPFKNEQIPVFGHKVSELAIEKTEIIKSTPWGNTFTLDFAKATLLGEKMGKGTATDFLAVSLSSTDYIGHQFGPNSVEQEDDFIRLDKEVASFLHFLDSLYGKNNYLLFLTADHGAAHIPAYLETKKVPAGVYEYDTLGKMVNRYMESKFGSGAWVHAFENQQLYLNHALMQEKDIDGDEVTALLRSYLLSLPGVAQVFDMRDLNEENYDAQLLQMIKNGYYPGRSGDIYVNFEPAWFEGYPKGTTHGTIYPYDTHIPLIFFGWKVKPKEDFSSIFMTDITATLAALLHIQAPNGCIGKPITGLLQK
ncbi:MAG: alkaline phosphatase family protein [Chitinophagales bacterium]|nr:alkaline phosphatase family protein [Chitinophagales bacterium]